MDREERYTVGVRSRQGGGEGGGEASGGRGGRRGARSTRRAKATAASFIVVRDRTTIDDGETGTIAIAETVAIVDVETLEVRLADVRGGLDDAERSDR